LPELLRHTRRLEFSLRPKKKPAWCGLFGIFNSPAIDCGPVDVAVATCN
jgi:hypothetical protein